MPSEISTCHDLKADGSFCRAAAVKGEKLCYFHYRAHAFRAAARQSPSQFAANLPVLDSPANIQAAIDQTAHAVAGGAIDTRTATVLLRAIQLASANLSALAASHASCADSVRAADQRPASSQRPAALQSAPVSAHPVRPTARPATPPNGGERPKSTRPPAPAMPPNSSPTALIHALLPHASQNRMCGLTHLTY